MERFCMVSRVVSQSALSFTLFKSEPSTASHFLDVEELGDHHGPCDMHQGTRWRGTQNGSAYVIQFLHFCANFGPVIQLLS